MRELLRGFDAVTSLVDYYGFKKKENKTPDELQSMILDQLNRTVARPVSTRRVFPYVQRHEFEALLFADIERFRCIPSVSERSVNGLVEVRGQFATPEDIDDGSETAPSKRLLQWVPNGSSATTSGSTGRWWRRRSVWAASAPSALDLGPG